MMSNSKRGLGKGLNALIPQGKVFMGGRSIINVEITKVIPNPRQPRTTFDKEQIKELAASIKEHGIIEPILTRMRGGKYELIAGERRLRAARVAGLSIVPSIVKDFSDEQSLEISLIENLQREDLNPLDEAEGYARLIKEFKMTQEQVAKRVGKNRSTVTNMLRILTLPDKIKESLRNEQISVSHARALLAVDNSVRQLELWRQIISNKMNVRDVEVLTGGKSDSKPKSSKSGRKRPQTQNVELNALVEKLTTYLGTKVKIYGSPVRGKIEIQYYSKEDLERILEILLFKNKPSQVRPTPNLASGQPA